MRTIDLTREQRDMVLRELDGQQGNFDIFVELNDSLTIEAEGYVYVDGYVEDDYLNGNGGFNETSRTADVILTAFASDKGENEEVCDVTGDFERECYEALQVA